VSASRDSLVGLPVADPRITERPRTASAAHDDNITTTLVTYSSLLSITATYLDSKQILQSQLHHLPPSFHRHRGFDQETVALPISASELLQADFTTYTAKTAIWNQDGVDV
jgi:hypothetical protein